MIGLLIKLFIKDKEKIKEPRVRTAYGILCSLYGVFLNILLFAGKLIGGALSGSIAIIADSFNNLGDAGSSVVTMLGFRLASKKPDSEHPYGHGRYEYISGLIVSFAIILMGFELGKSSLSSIIDPIKIEYSLFALLMLGVSIATKLYMAFYNNRIGRRIGSAAMRATAKDSLSDAISTSAILLFALLSDYLPFVPDGWAGLAVSALIVWTGIGSVKDTVSPLLGKSPDKEFVDNIYKLVMSHREICGVHDLVVHDYGPGRVMISLHAEVPVTMDIDYAHDIIDNIELELSEKLNCHTTIHMDPINSTDPETIEMKHRVSDVVRGLHPGASIHDFRMVKGQSHTNLIFDAVLPFDSLYESDEFADMIIRRIKAYDDKLNCVIRVDREFN